MFSLHMLLQQQDGLLPLLQPHFQVVDLLLLLQQLLLEAIIALLQRLAERLRRTDITEVKENSSALADGAKKEAAAVRRQQLSTINTFPSGTKGERVNAGPLRDLMGAKLRFSCCCCLILRMLPQARTPGSQANKWLLATELGASRICCNEQKVWKVCIKEPKPHCISRHIYGHSFRLASLRLTTLLWEHQHVYILTRLSSRLSKGPGGSSRHKNSLTARLSKTNSMSGVCLTVWSVPAR